MIVEWGGIKRERGGDMGCREVNGGKGSMGV